MGKFEKLLFKILSGTSDANISFEELRTLLLKLAFIERTTGGSHRIFYRDGIEEIINIQPNGNQVKQVRAIILKYKLATV
jgi:hypothetical protein